MKRLFIFVLCFALAHPCFGAFGAGSDWDVQTTGANTNGGAFDSSVGAPGTDESQGAGTAVTITTASSTTGTSSPAFSSTTHGPGNFVHIASGTGCVTGWHEMSSQAAGTGTFESAIADTNGRTCTGVIGGSLLTVGQASSIAVSLNRVHVKTGTYSGTTTITGTAPLILEIIGYGTNHGDGGTAPLLTTATNSIALITIPIISQFKLTNLSLSTTAGTPGAGVATGGNTESLWIDSSTLDGFSDCVATSAASVLEIDNTLIKNCTVDAVQFGVSFGLMSMSTSTVQNTTGGIALSNQSVVSIRDSIFSGQQIGVVAGSSMSLFLEGNTFYNHSTEAVRISGSNPLFVRMDSNIFYDNICAIKVDTAPRGAITVQNDFKNFFGGNTADGCGTVGYAPSASDTTGIANPFVNAGAGNFALGSGATALKGTGVPGLFPGGLTTGYRDIGAPQSQGTTTVTPLSAVYGQ